MEVTEDHVQWQVVFRLLILLPEYLINISLEIRGQNTSLYHEIFYAFITSLTVE